MRVAAWDGMGCPIDGVGNQSIAGKDGRIAPHRSAILRLVRLLRRRGQHLVDRVRRHDQHTSIDVHRNGGAIPAGQAFVVRPLWLKSWRSLSA